MAISEARSSSDAALALPGEYHVFLNFRGEDTRHGFTDYLYHGLTDAGVHVFRDEEKLAIGEVIGENLLSAINNSTIYIPIFSQSYASSKWCLKELALMVDYVSKSGGQKSILPIFFHVKPDDVKLKKPLYKAYFKKHEKDFPDEVEAWKGALREVDERKGWVVDKNTGQAEIIKSVVKEVLEKLKIKQKLVSEHLVGLDDRIKDLKKLSDVNHDDIRLIGIYGMGGIGKTTIAKVIFNQLCSHFGKYCSFLQDIRELLIKVGIVSLQKKLLSDIGGSGSVGEFNDSEEGMKRIRETLYYKKVLVVLDDVDNKVTIENLIGSFNLYKGSRIIITTRDKDILQVEGSDIKVEKYEMQTMDNGHALRLFCRHAFRKDYPSDDYLGLSMEVVSLLGGLPLAIEVVGSLLKDKKEKDFWLERLDKLRKVPEKDIIQRLRISYDDLDHSQKQIFLDLACFFFNEKEIDAIYMWKSCNFYPIDGIDVLKKRSLIKILANGMFSMHDQLIALGRQIVREDNLDDLRKQSRLWIAEEANDVISTEETKDLVNGLRICGSIRSEDFKRLPNLRFLYLNEGTCVGDFARCGSNLSWFSWCLPLEEDFGVKNLYLKRLVVCKLFDIKFKNNSKAWNLIKSAPNLKVLSFTRCSGITTIPNISGCSALERLTLGHCSSLKRIKSFNEKLRSLIELKIEGCKDFTDLPEEVGALVKLEHFSLSRCSMLRELPSSIGNLTSLTDLDLTGCHEIQELPELPTSLTCLCFHSRSLLSVPNLSNLTNLVELLLSNGDASTEKSNLSKASDLRWIGMLYKLKKLELDLVKVPAPLELASLSHLEELVLGHLDLKPLAQLPPSDWSLRKLSTLEIGRCEVVDIPLQVLPQLKKLTVGHCRRLRRLSIPLELMKIQQVQVLWCPELVEIQVVGLSKSLEILDIGHCEILDRIRGLSCLKNLEILSIIGCNELTTVEGLNELESLKYLDVWKYPSMTSFINVACAKIPADCVVHIRECGYSSQDFTFVMLWKNLVDKMERPFTIDFILKQKRSGGEFFVTRRKKMEFTPDSVTYEGLIDEVYCLGYQVKRMEYKTPGEDGGSFIEIKSDEQVKGMVQLASERGSIQLIVEGEAYFSLEGEMARGSHQRDVVLFLLLFCFTVLPVLLDSPWTIEQLAGARGFRLFYDGVVIFLVVLFLFLGDEVNWDGSFGCAVRSLVFFICVTVSLLLSLKLGFPWKIRQLAGVRGFGLCFDFVVIFLLVLFLFLGVKVNWDGMDSETVTECWWVGMSELD